VEHNPDIKVKAPLPMVQTESCKFGCFLTGIMFVGCAQDPQKVYKPGLGGIDCCSCNY
jgi:hypothetical protein